MSPRIQTLSESTAPAASAEVLARTKATLGMVPNLHKTLAHSRAALQSYAATAAALAGGELEPRLREKLAVAIAAHNSCEYCASAHTAIGKSLKIDEAELTRNLQGRSDDARHEAALRFAIALLDRRGDVDDGALEAVRAAGFSEAEVVEIVAQVGMNWFTNAFNRLARTEIDFPRIELGVAG